MRRNFYFNFSRFGQAVAAGAGAVFLYALANWLYLASPTCSDPNEGNFLMALAWGVGGAHAWAAYSTLVLVGRSFSREH